MSNKKPEYQQPKAVRVLALILAGLMIAGAATVVISILAGALGHVGHVH